MGRYRSNGASAHGRSRRTAYSASPAQRLWVGDRRAVRNRSAAVTRVAWWCIRAGSDLRNNQVRDRFSSPGSSARGWRPPPWDRRADLAAPQSRWPIDHHRPQRSADHDSRQRLPDRIPTQDPRAYGYLPPHVEQLVRLVEWKRLDLSTSIAARPPLEQATEAVRRLEEKDGDTIRLILRAVA